MIPWSCLASWALASPGSAGALHLGASPLPAGTQFAGAGGGVVWAGTSPAGAAVVEVGTAAGNRFALVAAAGVLSTAPPTAPLLVSGRYLAVDDEAIRLAVTLSGLAAPHLDPDRPGLETHLTPGFALDAGGEQVRFDAAVPVWGLASWNGSFGVERFPVPLLSTVGVSFALGDTQRLRVGLPELVSWHLRTERVYVDIGGATLILVGAAWFKVGAIF